MPWLIDGSNVLGALRADLKAVEPKRELARVAASFARLRKTKVTCYFDGPEPPSFARHLGAATIVFSGTRSADELIVERVHSGASGYVVTSDRELGARVGGRRVKVIDAAQFVRELQELERDPDTSPAEDWNAYFSDPKNRQKF
jgi:predicted RNA-binding protein with PIN domain